MAKKIHTQPKHPERICWGCDRYCSVNSLACGNGTERTLHPVKLFGEDWLSWALDAPDKEQQIGPAPLAEPDNVFEKQPVDAGNNTPCLAKLSQISQQR